MRRTKVYQKYTKFNSMCIHRYGIIGSLRFLRNVLPFSTRQPQTQTTSYLHILIPSPISQASTTNRTKHHHPHQHSASSILASSVLLACLRFKVGDFCPFRGYVSLNPSDNSSSVTPPFLTQTACSNYQLIQTNPWWTRQRPAYFFNFMLNQLFGRFLVLVGASLVDSCSMDVSLYCRTVVCSQPP